MHILICSPENNSATGNWVTASRYSHGLQRFNHRVTQCYLPTDRAVLSSVVEDYMPDLVVLLHAFRSGWQFILARQQLNLPVIVMLSGTDINDGLEDEKQAVIIEQVMLHADALLSHNHLQIAQLKSRYPHLTHHLHFVPPAIELGTTPYHLRNQYHFNADDVIFICPASVRPVKGVLELIHLFDALATKGQRWQLVFCGPVLDEAYATTFFNAVEQRDWVHYLGIIEREAMAAALSQVDVVLNNSQSEGLPNALIEASALGVPILARDIVGNRPVVDHDVNGFLYEDRDSFIRAANKLIHDASLRKRLSQPRAERYTVEAEAQVLNEICMAAVKKRGAVSDGPPCST